MTRGGNVKGSLKSVRRRGHDHGAGGGYFIGVIVGVGVADSSGVADGASVAEGDSEGEAAGVIGDDICDAWDDVEGRTL